MTEGAGQHLVDSFGVTGQLLRRALITREAPRGFREALLRQLVADAGQPAQAGVHLRQGGGVGRSPGRGPAGPSA